MSKSDSTLKSKSRGATTPTTPTASSKPSASESGTNQALVIAGMILLSVGYWFAFYTSAAERIRIWGYLLIPDLMVNTLVGNNWSRFGILDRIPILIGVAVILGLAYVWGYVVLSVLRVRETITALEEFVFAEAIGLNSISLITLAVGLVGQLRQRWLFAAIGVLILIAGAVTRLRQRSPSAAVPSRSLEDSGNAERTNPFSATQSPSWLSHKWLWLALPFVVCIVLGAMLPPWQYDVREYHLQVPKEWYQAGRISFLPHNIYGNMPLGSEVLSIPGMAISSGELDWWWGALIGKTLIGCFAPLTAIGLYCSGRRFVSASAGIVAAVVYLSMPWTVHESMAGLIEGSLGLYGFLAVYAMWLSKDSERWLLVAGYLSGAAAACKYPGVLFVVVPLTTWLVVLAARRRRWIQVVMFLLATTVGCGLWYAKNWVLTGNPTYPLLYSVFGGETRTPERDLQWRTAHQVPPNNNGQRYSAGQAIDALAMIGWRSSLMSPLLWPLGLASLAVWRRHKAILMALFAMVLYNVLVWWFVTHRIDRFLVPSFVFASLLAGIGASVFSSRAWRAYVTVTLIVGCIGNLLLLMSRENAEAGDVRLLVSLSDLRVDEPTKDDPAFYRTHEARRYLNRHVRDGSAVLLVGDAQPFDLEIPVYYNTCFDECQFETLFKGKNREERIRALRERNISHILIMWSELDRFRSPGNYGYSPYVSRELVRRELVEEQEILRPLPLDVNSNLTELFEVVSPTNQGDRP